METDHLLGKRRFHLYRNQWPNWQAWTPKFVQGTETSSSLITGIVLHLRLPYHLLLKPRLYWEWERYWWWRQVERGMTICKQEFTFTLPMGTHFQLPRKGCSVEVITSHSFWAPLVHFRGVRKLLQISPKDPQTGSSPFISFLCSHRLRLFHSPNYCESLELCIPNSCCWTNILFVLWICIIIPLELSSGFPYSWKCYFL